MLGGDGTILKALREYGTKGVPVFAINYGTVGFLAAAEAEELESSLERAFAGDYEIIEHARARGVASTPTRPWRSTTSR